MINMIRIKITPERIPLLIVVYNNTVAMNSVLKKML